MNINLNRRNLKPRIDCIHDLEKEKLESFISTRMINYNLRLKDLEFNSNLSSIKKDLISSLGKINSFMYKFFGLNNVLFEEIERENLNFETRCGNTPISLYDYLKITVHMSFNVYAYCIAQRFPRNNYYLIDFLNIDFCFPDPLATFGDHLKLNIHDSSFDSLISFLRERNFKKYWNSISTMYHHAIGYLNSSSIDFSPYRILVENQFAPRIIRNSLQREYFQRKENDISLDSDELIGIVKSLSEKGKFPSELRSVIFDLLVCETVS